jgi:hypothetical protein
MPQRTLPTGVAGNPKPQAQRNHRIAGGFAYTDPDSHIVKGTAGWNQAYNAQANVGGNHQVIMATSVSNQPSGAVHLLPMLERIQSNTDQLPDPFLADAGYCSTAKLTACDERGLEAYICTRRQQDSQRPGPSRSRAPRDLDALDRMDRKLKPRPAKRSTAYAKQSWSPYSARSRAPEAWITSGCEGWRT